MCVCVCVCVFKVFGAIQNERKKIIRGQGVKKQTRSTRKVAFLRKIADTSKETNIAKNVL